MLRTTTRTTISNSIKVDTTILFYFSVNISSLFVVFALYSNRKKNENKLGKLALIAVAAGVLTFGSVHDASAAKTGGRIGGQSFKSAAPRNSGPRINNNNSRFVLVN